MTNAIDAQKNLIFPIDEHLSFTEKLVYKYDWDMVDRLDFETRLNKIKRKHQDPLLNLSVVGEFGTGKSTLINALLRSDEFLVSSSLQGTTVAATIVENSPECAVFLEHTNGQQEYISFEDTEALHQGIVSFTTNPEIAQNLYNVNIRIPSEHLSTGFRIIDTPGLNANEKWHEKVTLRTLEEMSDMSVLIIDANKPLTSSFCEFVKLTLSDVLEQCVFLVTRIDMIRKRERQGILDYLKVKIAKEFSIEDPIVLPYSSISVLDELYGESSELAEISHQTEEKLLLHMKEKKESAQKKKLEALISDMFFSMSEKLARLSENCKVELEILKRSRQIDLAPFVEEQIPLRRNAFEEKALSKRPQIMTNLQNFTSAAHQQVMDEIDRLPSIEALQDFTANHLSNFCVSQAVSIIKECEKNCGLLQESFSSEMLGFCNAFEQYFKDCDILRIDLSNELFEKMAFPAINPASLYPTNKDIANKVAKAGKIPLGRTAAGAAIGSAIAPGVGTIIGGVIGFATKGLNSDLNTLKQTVKTKLSPALSSYFGNVLNDAFGGVTNYIYELKNAIENEIRKYLITYRTAISDRIKSEEDRIRTTEDTIIAIQYDMENITLRKQQLTSQKG